LLRVAHDAGPEMGRCGFDELRAPGEAFQFPEAGELGELRRIAS
jgi:hypothetical protein